jgi:dienelactone hydrolase
MNHKFIDYQCNGKNFKGYVSYPDTKQERSPAVLVAHAWRGQDDFARNKADELAKMGYIGFAADVYGDGISVNTDEEATALMKPLLKDRSELRQRIVVAYETLSKLPHVNSSKIGVIGFCFGGLTAIELLRSGVDLRGVVSFHGLFNKDANLPNAAKLKGSLLMLHGHDDPLVSAEDIAAIQKEMTEAAVDWQLHIYGHTSHAFTNPEVNDPVKGLLYNAKADRRSWQSMTNFFQEAFAQ